MAAPLVIDRPSPSRSNSKTFHLFPLLPTELKIQIFTYHANTSISSNGSFKSFLQMPYNNHNCRLLSLCRTDALYLTFDSKFVCQNCNCEELHLPPALKICHLSRQVILDLLWHLFRKQRPDMERTTMGYNLWSDDRYKEIKLLDFRVENIEVAQSRLKYTFVDSAL